ncbi:MAG: hypothetical protein HYY56_05565 [Candidatus Omnitrophica bacterium]|nr:hypothetical protein [Candidatus Omnitrophota bacterium]
MEFKTVDWKRGIISGVIAGAVWGCLAITINTASRAFIFEETLLHRLITFTAGGAIFGMVVSGVLSMTRYWMSSRNIFLEAICISVSLWGILEAGGILLHFIKPGRFHLDMAQIVQGIFLAFIMGVLLGFLWKIGKRAN